MSDLQAIGQATRPQWLADLAQSFQRNAARPALTVGDTTWTYGALWARAAALASTLASSDTPVTLIGTRSAQDYAAVLAIFLSGRTYLPLNPTATTGELRSLLELTGATTLLCARETPLFVSVSQSHALDARLIDLSVEAHALNPPAVGQYAYIIATSGSSGPPKAVPISHHNLEAYLSNAQSQLDIRASDRTSQIFELCFDLSLHDILISWRNGAHLHVAGTDDSMDLTGFAERHRLTVWFSTPSHARKALLRHKGHLSLENLRLSMFCGEPLTWKLARDWQSLTHGRIENWYGPSEATISVTRYVLPYKIAETPGGVVPIGKPIGRMPIALTHRGELCLAGPQVFDGYLGAKRQRRGFYPTGDLVSQDVDGVLQFGRRKGALVKIKGQFVDCRSIEDVITEVTGLDTTVLPWPYEAANPDGLMVVIPQNGPLSDALRTEIRNALSPSLTPQFVSIADMPLTASGKRDFSALAKRVETALPRQTRRPIKRYDRVIAFAQEANPALTQAEIARAANLMEAGLDSLAFTTFIARLEQVFSLTLTQVDVARLSRMTVRQTVVFLRQSPSHDMAETAKAPDANARSAPHVRAQRAFDFLAKFPEFLKHAPENTLPLVGSSGFMRGLDPQTIDQGFAAQGHQIRSANIGMAGLSNTGLCELCSYIADHAQQQGKRFPIAVLELELLQLSVLPPAGDVAVLADFKAGRFSSGLQLRDDPDTFWDAAKAGRLTERQGPWRPRDAPASWETRRHEEIRDIYSGDVALDHDAVDIWFTAIDHLMSASDQIAVVLHPLDGHVSAFRSGRGQLSPLCARLKDLPFVSVIGDDQFALESHHFRNFSHLNERGGRQSFSDQLAAILLPLLR